MPIQPAFLDRSTDCSLHFLEFRLRHEPSVVRDRSHPGYRTRMTRGCIVRTKHYYYYYYYYYY